MKYGYPIKEEAENNSVRKADREYDSHRRIRIVYSDKEDNNKIERE